LFLTYGQGLPGYESTRIMLGKGFGFITFDTLDNANSARAIMTGRAIRGLSMRINYGRVRIDFDEDVFPDLTFVGQDEPRADAATPAIGPATAGTVAGVRLRI
jgi:hypothetical protein